VNNLVEHNSAGVLRRHYRPAKKKEKKKKRMFTGAGRFPGIGESKLFSTCPYKRTYGMRRRYLLFHKLSRKGSQKIGRGVRQSICMAESTRKAAAA
jgi:hypothetical protein